MNEKKELSDYEFREILSKSVLVDKIRYENLQSRLKEADKVIDQVHESGWVVAKRLAEQYKQKYGGENE